MTTTDAVRGDTVAAAGITPLSLRIDTLAAMLNLELPEHPVYDSLELQWFDDDEHGTGMLAFLCRRDGRRVDYYAQPGLRLDRSGYEIAGGVGAWIEDAVFEAARLEVAEDGVVAEARFVDIDGRLIEIAVDDRDGRPRRRSHLLAPVSAAIERPNALLLVWLPGFDLVRDTGTPPVIRIGGEDAVIGRLPGARLHRRRLIKYTAPLCAVELNRNHSGPLAAADGTCERTPDGSAVTAVTATQTGHAARLRLEPAMPDPSTLADGDVRTGRWCVSLDEARLTGGGWRSARTGERVAVGMDVDERWRPGRVSGLVRVVTTVVPVFRRWPTTYRWRGDVTLSPTPAMAAAWERTDSERGQAYLDATKP